MSPQKIKLLTNKAIEIRKDIICMMARADASHSGSSLSVVDLLVALFFGLMRVNPRQPGAPNRDRFILSKGHGGAALYATLAARGYFPRTRLDTFCKDKSRLLTHPVRGCVPGVEVTTGSLGHGLSFGVGMAIDAKTRKKKHRIFVMLSDGECDEGSVWEAILYAGFHGLDNVVAIVDYNKIQSFGRTREVLDLEPFTKKWEAFGWRTREIDGHDFKQIFSTINSAPFRTGHPSCIIAHTIKGKNVSYMEDQLEWHYRSPKGKFLDQALRELEIQKEQ